jgi:hypothetical protein
MCSKALASLAVRGRMAVAMDKDLEHLRLLSIFHYVVATLMAVCACIPLVHLAIGLMFLFAPPETFRGDRGQSMDEQFRLIFGLAFTIIPGLIILAGWATAICVFVAGRSLAGLRRYTFCMIIAAVECVFMPFGTVLGVFALIVLSRPSVKALFDSSRPRPPKDSFGPVT